MTRSIIVLVLCALAAIPAAPASAQPVGDADAWRVFASHLEPNAFVRIRLANGKSLRGHVVRVDDEVLRLNPRTRVAVPLQQYAYSEIVSIERQKEPKWNPASKVLLGVGIGVGVLYAIAIAAVASIYD